MDTYISIAEDVTPETVRQIEAAKGDVYVVHAICATIPGRRKLALILKRRGVRPELVHQLGWATAEPPELARSKPCSPSPSSPSSPPPPPPKSVPDPPMVIEQATDGGPAVVPTGTSGSSRRKGKRTSRSGSSKGKA